MKMRLHSTGDASRLAALLLSSNVWTFSVVAPCQPGASPVSVRRRTFTTDTVVGSSSFSRNRMTLATTPPCSEAEEELDAISVGENGVRADVALTGEVVLEKPRSKVGNDV